MHSVHFGSVRVLALTCCEERGLGVYACQADHSFVELAAYVEGVPSMLVVLVKKLSVLALDCVDAWVYLKHSCKASHLLFPYSSLVPDISEL